ncbi:MAG: GDP-mannose 4,6-dehydratase [Verrucomicrobia bacterium]|nr:GDP-mannose 4,6-dehydratase [Verrucomicrobiota bacterium]
MRVLVTGASGFVGRYVLEELQQHGHTVIPMLEPGIATQGYENAQVADLRDPESLAAAVQSSKPDGCIHLAGCAFVPLSWSDPRLVFEINMVGAINVLEAFRHHQPDARYVFVSSAEVYGRKPLEGIIDENTPLTASNPYAAAKIAADLTTLLYAGKYGMHTMTVRPQNHIGPGQADAFVVPSFAKQLAAIARGRTEPLMRVGNLESKRHFVDVRDVARAYRLLLEKGSAGEAYNVAADSSTTIQEVLDLLCDQLGIRPEIFVDPERFRPADESLALSAGKIRKQVGWSPQIPLEKTLEDILESYRTRP